MEWRYKIWLLAVGAVLTLIIAWNWSQTLAIVLLVAYLVLFPLTIKKQFGGDA